MRRNLLQHVEKDAILLFQLLLILQLFRSRSNYHWRCRWRWFGLRLRGLEAEGRKGRRVRGAYAKVRQIEPTGRRCGIGRGGIRTEVGEIELTTAMSQQRRETRQRGDGGYGAGSSAAYSSSS